MWDILLYKFDRNIGPLLLESFHDQLLPVANAAANCQPLKGDKKFRFEHCFLKKWEGTFIGPLNLGRNSAMLSATLCW